MLKLHLRPMALADLESLWDYTANHWSEAQAEAYIRTINKTFETLVQNPSIGMTCEDVLPHYRKLRAANHIIYYRLFDTGIDIVRILHQNMDAGKHI